MKQTVTLEKAKGFNPRNLENQLYWFNRDVYNFLVKVFEPRYDVLVWVDISQYEEDETGEIKWYVEHIYATIQGEINGISFELKPYLKPYLRNKKCSFSLVSDFTNEYVKDFCYNVERPKCIGAPTEKKMLAWVEYLMNEREAKFAHSEANRLKTLSCYERLLPYENEIRWDKGRKSGTIYKGDYKYDFEIGSDGHMYEKIEYQGSCTIEHLMEMTR